MIAIDLYFLMNLAYDLTLLCMVGMVLKKPLRFLRVLVASLLGAGWSLIILILTLSYSIPTSLGFWGKLITYGLCPYLMCQIAYKKEKDKFQAIELFLTFYAMGALISGLMLLLKWTGISMPSWVLMPICSAISLALWKILTDRQRKRTLLCEVVIRYHEKTVTTKALYDSGNTLMTKTGRPVHVLAPSLWKTLVGEDAWQNASFAISYQTIGETGVMAGIDLDEIQIKQQKPIVLTHVVAGLGNRELDQSGAYQLLLNRVTFK